MRSCYLDGYRGYEHTRTSTVYPCEIRSVPQASTGSTSETAIHDYMIACLALCVAISGNVLMPNLPHPGLIPPCPDNFRMLGLNCGSSFRSTVAQREDSDLSYRTSSKYQTCADGSRSARTRRICMPIRVPPVILGGAASLNHPGQALSRPDSVFFCERFTKLKGRIVIAHTEFSVEVFRMRQSSSQPIKPSGRHNNDCRCCARHHSGVLP